MRHRTVGEDGRKRMHREGGLMSSTCVWGSKEATVKGAEHEECNGGTEKVAGSSWKGERGGKGRGGGAATSP